MHVIKMSQFLMDERDLASAGPRRGRNALQRFLNQSASREFRTLAHNPDCQVANPCPARLLSGQSCALALVEASNRIATTGRVITCRVEIECIRAGSAGERVPVASATTKYHCRGRTIRFYYNAIHTILPSVIVAVARLHSRPDTRTAHSSW
jgi:hypothetical protein